MRLTQADHCGFDGYRTGRKALVSNQDRGFSTLLIKRDNLKTLFPASVNHAKMHGRDILSLIFGIDISSCKPDVGNTNNDSWCFSGSSVSPEVDSLRFA